MALEKATSRHQANIESAAEYLASRAISPASADRFRLGVVGPNESYAGRLAIPGIGLEGVYSLRYRSLREEEPKYLGHEDMPTRLFNLRALHEARDTIHITEGEIDAITLEQCGLHAVGVPGVKNWKKHHPRMFAGFSHVWVWADGDDAGHGFARKICGDISSASTLSMEAGLDANSLYVKEGQDGIEEAVRRSG